MLFLRKNYALELLEVSKRCYWRGANPEMKRELILKQQLAIRYPMFNGLSNMEVCNGRIEHMDPVDCVLELPRRHWKNNCIADVDPETVRLQIIYSGGRKKGPLLRSRKTHGHFTRNGLRDLVRRVALHTTIPNKERINPIILKRTYARLYLKTPGNTVEGLRKSFSHKHLWSTAHYLRFVMEDVKVEKARMMERLAQSVIFTKEIEG